MEPTAVRNDQPARDSIYDEWDDALRAAQADARAVKDAKRAADQSAARLAAVTSRLAEHEAAAA